MDAARRILFVPESPLSASAESFLGRESISVSAAATVEDVGNDPFDLIILNVGDDKNVVSRFADCSAQNKTRILGVGDTTPPEEVLDYAQAYLVKPYSQGELIGAIGDLLGTHLRRALRMGVEIPARMSRADDIEDVAATLLQLSETGCLIEADSPIRVGETVMASFVLPSNREAISIEAMIVSTNELQLLYGLKWGRGYEAERLAILVFVELGLASGASSAPRGEGGRAHPTATTSRRAGNTDDTDDTDDADDTRR